MTDKIHDLEDELEELIKQLIEQIAREGVGEEEPLDRRQENDEPQDTQAL